MPAKPTPSIAPRRHHDAAAVRAAGTHPTRGKLRRRLSQISPFLQIGALIALALLAANHPDTTRDWVDKTWLVIDRLQ